MLVRRLSNVMFENFLRNKSKNLEINSLSTYQLFVTYIVRFIMKIGKIGKILLKTCCIGIQVSFYIVSQIIHLEIWHKICQKNMSLHTNFVCLKYSKLFLAPPTKALIGIDEVKVCNSRWMSKFGAIIPLSLMLIRHLIFTVDFIACGVHILLLVFIPCTNYLRMEKRCFEI